MGARWLKPDAAAGVYYDRNETAGHATLGIARGDGRGLSACRGLALAARHGAAPIAPWDRVENVRLGGFNRHFIVHVPPTFDAKRKLAS